jgi:single-strand DNA-binding protein
MGRGVNKVILLGRCGRLPTIKYFPNGKPVASFNLATTEKEYDSATGDYNDYTEWHRVVAYSPFAEVIRGYVKKGTLLYIEGRNKTRSYDSNEGTKRYITEVIARTVQVLSARELQELENAQKTPINTAEIIQTLTPEIDDIPF